MGLITSLGRFFGKTMRGNEQDERQRALAEVAGSLRTQARIAITDVGVARLRLANGREGSVNSLSYCGVAAEFSGTAAGEMPAAAAELRGRLMVLGSEVPCRLQTVRVVANPDGGFLAAFSFFHDHPHSLLLLRDMIEPWKCGESLREVRPDLLHERFKDSGWCCFRGDGPTDLAVKMAPAGTKILEAFMTMRRLDSYVDLRYRDGQIVTSKMLEGTNGESTSGDARMSTSHTPDLVVLRQAVATLSGAPSDIHSRIKPVLDAALALLKSDPHATIAA